MTRARLALVLCLLAAAGCAPHEPPSTAIVIRTAVLSAGLACKIYATDLSIPRDEAVTEFCRLKCEAK